MNQHITTNGKNEGSEEFMLSFDVSPLVACRIDGHELDETLVLKSLDPLTKNRKKLLQHPLVNTFVLLKYNSYTIFFMTILFLKIFHSIILTCLAMNDMQFRYNNATENNTTITETNNSSSFLIYYSLTLVVTALMFLNEVGEILIKKANWFDFVNMVQMCHLLLIFLYQALIYSKTTELEHFKYLPTIIVFVSWMDLTFSFQSLLFGKWSSLGLYISMLTEVDLSIRLSFRKFALVD